ncbi:uncharacterized protein LOC123562263 [Mercenaria mercenaria]|uniref:uncharacterized protein LOC123562263 n=1 Tax=Mercenaria mercenaria TaxID=6596 RepID=UPI00234EAD43|nr:uncharacterized protein LOC123562263 [Mercenaria mercenaria]
MSSNVLTPQELEDSEKMWISHVQRNKFSDVFESIAEKKKNNLQFQLGIYIDSNGLLRCKGRLENAELTESARSPLLLPRNDRFTNLVIEREHKQMMHSGVSQTLSRIRNSYWIPHGRATLKRVLNMCLVCRRTEGGPYKMPPMAPLPRSRVSLSSPFTRFIACRGKPNEIVCDNALHFKVTSQTTELVWNKVLRSDDIQNYCSNEGIKWHFIVKVAPWMGGFMNA